MFATQSWKFKKNVFYDGKGLALLQQFSMENYCVLGGRKLRYKDCLLKLNSKGVEPHKINENKPKDPGVATQHGKILKMYFMMEKD